MFALEDIIGAHACSLEMSMCVTTGIPLGCSLLLPVDAVNCVQTLKGFMTYWTHTGDATTLKAVLPAVVGYLLSWKTTPTGRGDGGALVAPRACPGQPHIADEQCTGIWDWCDGTLLFPL
jgi:hypothetical protein